MKAFVFCAAVVFSFAALKSGFAATPAESPAKPAEMPDRASTFALIRKAKVPGRNQPSQYLLFAHELKKILDAAGVPSHVVIFEWSKTRPVPEHGTHAILVFRCSDGRNYGLDSTSWPPRWLPDGEPSLWAQYFLAQDTLVERASIEENKAETPAPAAPK